MGESIRAANCERGSRNGAGEFSANSPALFSLLRLSPRISNQEPPAPFSGPKKE